MAQISSLYSLSFSDMVIIDKTFFTTDPVRRAHLLVYQGSINWFLITKLVFSL